MRKFSDKINESVDEQLDMGIKIESEHGDIYEYLEDHFENFNLPMPLSKEEFYKKIAESHLKEIPDYYTRLSKMEKE